MFRRAIGQLFSSDRRSLRADQAADRADRAEMADFGPRRLDVRVKTRRSEPVHRRCESGGVAQVTSALGKTFPQNQGIPWCIRDAQTETLGP
jgi:hypothetical protein